MQLLTLKDIDTLQALLKSANSPRYQDISDKLQRMIDSSSDIAKFASKGGKSQKEKHGSAGMSEWGKLGAEKRWGK